VSIFQKVQDWQRGKITADDVVMYAIDTVGRDRARDLMAEGVAWWEKVGRFSPLTLGEHKPNPAWAARERTPA
jgi:hypothetical protein